jgi:hypothetical protein
MLTNEFGLAGWMQDCERMARNCKHRAMSPLHFTCLLGQGIDDALARVPEDQHDLAIEVARDFGYETSDERMELQVWLSQRSGLSASSHVIPA